jgi:hypothetical protein
VRPVSAGQCLRHAQFGLGVAVDSNQERTTIDFYEHGRKLFVTGMLAAELVADAPAKPPKPKAPRSPKPKAAGAR